MNGVIVQTERIYRGFPISVSALIVILVAFFIANYTVRLIRFCQRNKSDSVKAVILFACIAVILATGVCVIINQAMTIHKDLIVTIDDSVRFHDFHKMYEIRAKDGNLYIVRELTQGSEEVEDE